MATQKRLQTRHGEDGKIQRSRWTYRIGCRRYCEFMKKLAMEKGTRMVKVVQEESHQNRAGWGLLRWVELLLHTDMTNRPRKIPEAGKKWLETTK